MKTQLGIALCKSPFRDWCVGLLVLWLAACGEMSGQTAFTYQGRLTDGGVASSGQYDLKFALWDAVTGGNAVGAPLTLVPVPASEGVFTVSLDFGATVFNGVARWLEVSLRTNGSVQAYQVVAPRYAINYTPQAIYALTVADGAVTAAKIGGVLNSASIPSLDAGKITSGIFAPALIPNLDAAKLISGTLSVARIPSLDAAQIISGTFGASQIPNLDAAKVTSGTFAVARIPSLDAAQIISGSFTASQIPNLDAAKITTGTLLDARIGTAIARGVDVTNLVNTTSNVLSTRLVGTNDALVTLINSLSAQLTLLNANLNALSNRTETNIFASASFVSADAADANLLARGLRNVITVPAPVWVNGNSLNAPPARAGHSAVWTGQEMIVWGGTLGIGNYSAMGEWYRLELDAWTMVSTINAPSARSGHSAVWSGSEMLVWGGFSGSVYLNTGARFSVANQLWSTINLAGAPLERNLHLAVWTGTRMVIWGGRNDVNTLADGAAYDPANNTWSALPASGPAASANATAVWTGDRVLIWGGDGANGFINTGAQLLCNNGTPSQWVPINLTGAPSARYGHTAVWTGSRMIIWGGFNLGGYSGDGAAYDPISNTWQPLSTVNAPTARALHNAVWTGSEMVVFGGESNSGTEATGVAYDPAANQWRVLSNPGAPQARSESTVVWTGAEAIFFGGRNAGSPRAALQRLNPQPTWYFFRKP